MEKRKRKNGVQLLSRFIRDYSLHFPHAIC